MINNNLKNNFQWLNDRPLYASISGGKDSTALALWLKEQEIDFTPVFIDTGFEHELTYQYIEDTLKPLFGDFITLKNESLFQEIESWSGGMEQAIFKNKIFPSGRVKFCTRLLKIVPIQNFYSEIRSRIKKKPINAVGIRAEESFKRSQLLEIEEQDEATSWRPILNLTQKEVISIHHRHNIKPNPLYLKGYSRVGCFPCIFSNKSDIRQMSFLDPERIEYLDALEQRVNNLRNDKDKKATFFRSKKKNVESMSIRQVVEWSKQYKNVTLNDSNLIENSGCMRWGLCEPVYKKGDQLSLL